MNENYDHSTTQQDINAAKNEIELNFWDLNAKENLWLRLKSLSLFENVHILLLVYNADDTDSFSSIESIYHDF